MGLGRVEVGRVVGEPVAPPTSLPMRRAGHPLEGLEVPSLLSSLLDLLDATRVRPGLLVRSGRSEAIPHCVGSGCSRELRRELSVQRYAMQVR